MTKTLGDFRVEIDEIDRKVARLLAERFAIATEVAALKRATGIPVRLQDRIDDVLAHVGMLAKENGAEPEAIRAIYETVIEQTCLHDEALIGKASQ